MFKTNVFEMVQLIFWRKQCERNNDDPVQTVFAIWCNHIEEKTLSPPCPRNRTINAAKLCSSTVKERILEPIEISHMTLKNGE